MIVPGATDMPLLQLAVLTLADPFGVVFDAEDGTPVDGAVVTMVDATTGQPARVFAETG